MERKDNEKDCKKEVCRNSKQPPSLRGGLRRSSATCPSKCAVPTNIENSTQILFVEPNFTETPSEYEVFYDCHSEHDMPIEGSSPKAGYVPQPTCTPNNESNMDKSSTMFGLYQMPTKSDVLTVNVELTPVETTDGVEILNVNYLPQASKLSKCGKCKKCNPPKSNAPNADYVSNVDSMPNVPGKCKSGGKCKKCNKPVLKPDNASNMDMVCKADYVPKACDVKVECAPKAPESSKGCPKCKKCNMSQTDYAPTENFVSKTDNSPRMDCMSMGEDVAPEPSKTCPKCKVCKAPNISEPKTCGVPKTEPSKACCVPKAEPSKASCVPMASDVSASCALPKACDVPNEGTVLPTKCMPNIVGCLSDCKDFRVALQHVVATATKLLTDFDVACRREKRCQRRKSRTRTVQLEVTAKLAPTCSSQVSGVVIDPFSFTIPLQLHLHATPPGSKLSLDVGGSVSKVHGSCCKTSMEPIRTATISAMNRSCQFTASEQDIVPIVKQASCCTMTMVRSAQMVQMKTFQEAFQSEEPFDKAFEDFQSLVPECACTEIFEIPKEPEPEPEPEPDECTCTTEIFEIPKEPEPPKPIYHQALPQHRCLDTCTPCRYSPSPLIDEEGRVFCPYNCGCCLCPWKKRATDSLEDRLKHQKIKVCKCRERGTIFTEFEKVDPNCSVTSYFDVCPCREKAEATFLELYGTEMWTVDERLQENVRGAEVKLEEVMEITLPNEPRRWPSRTHG